MPRIVLIAGEASGDQLARGLIEALRVRFPDAVFEGITGPLMRRAGCKSWGNYDQLAVMGVVEVIRHLPRLLRLKRDLVKRLLDDPPDVFIGIDAPDFNLRIEKIMRKSGIPAVHYVCPSVWAWRQGRVKTIRESCDLVLCLLPFERDFVERHGVNARFVGHPLADEISPEVDQQAARGRLHLADGPVVALLPGSRTSELERLGSVFLEAAQWLRQRLPTVRFISAAASDVTADIFRQQSIAAGLTDDVQIVSGQVRDVMAAADAVLVTSGTATLETMLMQRPMVVSYKASPLTAWLLRKSGLVKISLFSMPNLLAGYELVPELMQEAATGPALGEALLKQMQPGEERDLLLQKFRELGATLRKSASDRAADAIAELLNAPPASGSGSEK